MDHNPHLDMSEPSDPNREAGKGRIEVPDQVVNIVHQTRSAPPTDYENRLGEALEKIFGDDVVELADIIDRLNQIGVQTPGGGPWTEDVFLAEMKRLGV